MSDILQKLAVCIEEGKISKDAPFPPQLKGQDGADELTRRALQEGIAPQDILNSACMVGMTNIGAKFRENKVFVPNLLMAAKAMYASIEHLRPYFLSGEVKRKGTFIIGTVTGDLHDIGKNLVKMIVEGGGWEIVDLGVDVSAETFVDALQKHPYAVVGLSALLTTTMANMQQIAQTIKERNSSTKILVGGAPVTEDFCEKIGADFYAPDPQTAVDYLETLAPAA